MPAWLEWLAFWRPPFVYRLVLVQLTTETDTAVRGVLWRSRGPWLVMRQAALCKAGVPPQPMPGEVVIHRTNVAFVQIPPDAHHQ